MENCIFAVLVISSIFAFSEATVCKTKTDCSADSCCYIEPEFLIMSRRRQAGFLPVSGHVHHDTGVCEKYRVLGDHCGPLETANGHCGCGSGMSCRWVAEPTTAPLVAQVVNPRSMVYHPGPGAYKCAVRVCEKYRAHGDQCSPLEQMNGHCGCGSGMACVWVPDSTTTATVLSHVVRRKLPGHNEPGAYRCAMK